MGIDVQTFFSAADGSFTIEYLSSDAPGFVPEIFVVIQHPYNAEPRKCRLTPDEAWSLAHRLMDYAREAMPKVTSAEDPRD